MISLGEIDRQIRRLTAESASCRPFLCDGSPIGCEVAQVGINPSTLTPFWRFWNSKSGCNKDGWIEDYKSRNGRLLPTRDRIEVLCCSLEPLRCLELNLSHHYAKSEAELSKEQLADTAVFDYMLQAIKPRLLVVHGNKPIRHLERVLGVVLAKDSFTSASYLGSSIDVFAATRHFAYVSREYVGSVGARIKARLSSQTPKSSSSAVRSKV